MNSIETKRIVYISNPNEKYQRMVTMNATDGYNCHVLALCPALRMNAYTSACTHGLVELNSGGPSVCQCHAMRCDAMGMRCHAVCDAMRCDGLTSVGLAIYLTELNWLCMHIVWWLLNDSNLGGLIVLAHSECKYSSH